MANPLDWFLKEKPAEETQLEQFQTEETFTTVSTTSLGDDVPLKDKIESVRTDKFNEFLKQLENLKSVAGLNTLARYQAAMATSQITLEEIRLNISAMKSKLNEESINFKSMVNGDADKFEQEVSSLKNEIESQITERTNKVNELNEEVKELNEKINEANSSIVTNKAQSAEKLNTFQSSANELETEISSLASEIEINLK